MIGDRQLAKDTVIVTASGSIAKGVPVGIYKGANGKLMGIACAVDANTDMSRIGVAEVAIADEAEGQVIVNGLMPFLAGGTAAKGVTAITITGTLTAASTITSTLVDDGTIKGYCVSTGVMYKNADLFL